MAYPTMSYRELKEWQEEINSSEYYDPSDRTQFDIEMEQFGREMGLKCNDDDMARLFLVAWLSE